MQQLQLGDKSYPFLFGFYSMNKYCNHYQIELKDFDKHMQLTMDRQVYAIKLALKQGAISDKKDYPFKDDDELQITLDKYAAYLPALTLLVESFYSTIDPTGQVKQYLEEEKKRISNAKEDQVISDLPDKTIDT